MNDTIPKQELLLKLLKKTTTDHDGEALLAIRKANELLTAAGWDWEKLIHAKITVVGDPFASIPDIPRSAPRPSSTAYHYTTTPPRAPPKPYAPTMAKAPRPRRRKTSLFDLA